MAVQNKSSKVIDMIVNNGKYDPKGSCLDYAFYLSDFEIAKQLILVNGLDVNYNLNSYETSLKKAIELGSFKKVEMIIHHPTFDPVKLQVKLAILEAVEKHSVGIFNILLSLINNVVNIISPEGNSLLVAASQRNANYNIYQIITNTNFDASKSQMYKSFIELVCRRINFSFDVIEKLYEIDQIISHLIDFTKLLPNGPSFFKYNLYYENLFSASYLASSEMPIDAAKYLLNHWFGP